HQQAGQKTAPDQRAIMSNYLLHRGSHPQKTSLAMPSKSTMPTSGRWLLVGSGHWLAGPELPLAARRACLHQPQIEAFAPHGVLALSVAY
ncbi:hypothetical protein, partial [Mesorhizobium sp. M0323]|uniref:hypothetical protein n=1 Tax=Mesorhizobium sp. M0323 TaxID=2956938 RepID=UPI003336DF37